MTIGIRSKAPSCNSNSDVKGECRSWLKRESPPWRFNLHSMNCHGLPGCSDNPQWIAQHGEVQQIDQAVQSNGDTQSPG